MKFHAVIEFEFTRELTKDAEALAEILKQANDSVLSRGAPKDHPEEGAKIADWKLEKHGLVAQIESGGVVRAHAAVIRLRNLLNQELGRKLRVGVKAIKVREFRVSDYALKKKPLDAEGIVISFFVESLRFKGDKAEIVFKDLNEELLENGSVDRLLALLDDKIEAQYYEGKSEIKEFKWASREKKAFYDKDPAVELEARHWIARTRAKAQFVYGPNFTVLVNAFKNLVFEHVYAPLGFREMLFPKFESWDVPKRSGHAKTIYPDAFFVYVPRESNPKVWVKEKDYFRITGEVYDKEFSEKLAPVGIMSYAQCPPFWNYLSGRTIRDESLPFKTFDWSGPTYRNEAGGTQGISRLEEFHRVETLFLGTPEQVKQTFTELDAALTKFYDGVLDLEFKKFWVTPWFLAQEGKKILSEKEGEGVGTFDYEFWLPWRGPRETSEYLETQNLSNNGDKYPKGFSVKTQKGELWSGCAGTSFERLICSFLSQKGFEAKNWPNEVRDRVEFTEDLKFA